MQMAQIDAEIIDIECFTQGQQYKNGKSHQLAPFILEWLHLENPYGPNLSAVSTDHIWYWDVTFVNKRGGGWSFDKAKATYTGK